MTDEMRPDGILPEEMRPLAISILAGEAVLGTATPAEQAAVRERLANDADFLAEVAAWEERLAPLAEAVRPIDPDPLLWPKIAAQTLAGPAAPAESAAGATIQGEAAPVLDVEPARPTPDIRPGAGPATEPPLGTAADLQSGLAVGLEEALSVQTRYLRARITRWRLATAAATALAAGLAVFAFLGPRFLERDGAAEYLAVVNASGDLPPLIVRVDLARGELAVEPIGIQPAPGKSHELWALASNEKPVSLGLVTRDRRSILQLGAEAIRDRSLTLAVSVEPEGGSPTGQPTGPVVLTGKLVPLP
jgi:anti-sigma-K factor RskA